MLPVMIIALIIVASIVVVVVAFVKDGKGEKVVASKGDSRYASLEDKAIKEAEKMPDSKKATILRQHSTDAWESKIADDVMIKISALHVVSIDVYGVTFNSVKHAVNKSSLSDDNAFELIRQEKELQILRKMKFDSEVTYKSETSPLLGKVYAYNSCKIVIETKSKAPARIMIVTKKLADNGIKVSDIYVAASDIRNAKSYDHYDMTKSDIANRYFKLVDENPEYKDEAEVINTILLRIEKYNYLIVNNLLKINGSTFVFSIPNDEQLQTLIDMNVDMPAAVNTVVDDEEDDSNDLFENVHSSAV